MFTNVGYVQQTFTVTSLAGWSYLGCYTDGLDTRALSSNIYFDNAMTVEKCAAFCKSNNNTVAGVEYGTQCYCGDTIAGFSVSSGGQDPIAYGCNMPCGGNSAEYCGGPVRLNVYSLLD
jgi:hypothetical protein